MTIDAENIKTSYTDADQFHVYTVVEGFGRVVLENKIDECHLELRRKHWTKLLNKIVQTGVTDKIEFKSEEELVTSLDPRRVA